MDILSELNASDIKVLDALGGRGSGTLRGRKMLASFEKLAGLGLCTSRPWSMLSKGYQTLRLLDDQRTLTLTQLCQTIKERLDAAPDFDNSDMDTWTVSRQARDNALQAIFADLQANHGATTGNDYRGATLNLAGIKATSTGGIDGALRNWMTAARKHIDAAETAGA